VSSRRCSFCKAPLERTFVDLGMAPLVSSYVDPRARDASETFYPLHVYVCDSCLLVQLPQSASPEELFGEYPYFSSVSESWLRHAERYTEGVTKRYGLGPGSRVVEIASNDGYLLQYFRRRGIPVLGVEPARNVARAAQQAGIPTEVAFFGSETARRLRESGVEATLLVGNNVLAHVPDIDDFVAGLRILLGERGVATLEFPHLLRLIDENQFDTIFHEHFSYLSLLVVERVFAHHGLTLFDVEELPTHGGSLRIHARHAAFEVEPVSGRVAELLARERAAGLDRPSDYGAFERKVHRAKRRLLELLVRIKAEGKSIAGYGAPGKGCVLLNYCGIRSDFLDYTVDRSPHKQGWLMPGVRIPIHPPDRVARTRPDYLLILPWNLREEVVEQMAFIRQWGGRFIVPIPEARIVE
jgi:hypothetical protein